MFRIEDDTVWGSQSENVPDVSCVKSSAKVMIWGAMGVSGLSNLHIVPTGKTVDSSYYIEHIFKKEFKPALNCTRTTGKINSRKLVPYPGLAVFMQDGATPHTAAATQTWCDMVRQQPAKLYRETRMAWQFTRSKLYRESLEYIGLRGLQRSPPLNNAPVTSSFALRLEDHTTTTHRFIDSFDAKSN